MAKVNAFTWALVLGLALALTGAVSIVAFTATPAPAQTQATQTMADSSVAADSATSMSTEPWPALSDGACTNCSMDDSANVTIVLEARWGYLNDPAVAGMEGAWRFNDTGTSGGFAGVWRFVFQRIGGEVRGTFSLPADGNGAFRGRWNVSARPYSGDLWGAWVRVNATQGYFVGKWNVTGGQAEGSLAGRWIQSGASGGGFRGSAVAAPSVAPVDWDGSLSTTDGSVHILRAVRFEPNDHILRQTDPMVVEWNSTTTVNWDGILAVLRFPQGRPGPNVTLQAGQVSFTWTARQLVGLHLRERVDAAGHEIEVVGFLVEPRPAPEAARFQVQIRWGNLSSTNGTDLPTGNRTVWDGFTQVTYGGLALERVLSFERGDMILPPDNRVTVSWRSTTTTGWDGVLLGALVPLPALNDTYVTVHAGAFSHVFTVAELVGDHVFDMGNGNQVEVHAVRL